MALVICMMDAHSGWGTSTATDALICCSTTQEIATGGLAHTPASADSCSGALRETPLGSARYGTGGHSGLATLTVTDAPMCCFITQEIATGGLAHTPASADSCSGALREILPGSVRWRTGGPSGWGTSTATDAPISCSTTPATATGGWVPIAVPVAHCSGALWATH